MTVLANKIQATLLIIFLALGSFPASAFNQYQGYASYVPAGTPIPATLSQALGSQFSRPGDTFTASLAGPVYAGSSLVAPPGSIAQGTVVGVTPPGRGGKPGSLDLRLTTIITPDGRRIPLSASVDQNNFKLEAEGGRASSLTKATAVGAGAGALSGLIGGAISGGKFGRSTAIGTGIGAGVGLLGGGIRKGNDVVIPQGANIPFKLDAPVQIANSAPPVQQVSPRENYGYAPPNSSTPPSGMIPQSLPQQQASPASPFSDPGASTGGGLQEQEPFNPYLYD